MKRYRPKGMHLELGVFLGLFNPSEQHSFVVGTQPRQAYDTAFELGARAGFYPLAALGLEGEIAVMPSGTADGQGATFLMPRAHLIGQLPLFSVQPFVLLGAGRMSVDSDALGQDTDPGVYWGGGVKVPFADFAMARLDLRDIMTASRNGGSRPHHFEALLGVSFNLFGEHEDSDGDGFINLDDDCPRKCGVAPDGCPSVDSDGDGFTDDVDRCPKEAGVAPDGCPIRDQDGDGLLDPEDKCPTVAGAAPTGCPDTDGDGFVDPDDKCPTEAGVAPDGCPLRDTDGDGILDKDDKCVDQPETVNGFEDDDGCPDELPDIVKQFSGVIEGIEFDFGKDTIRKNSTAVLDKAAQVLLDYPSLKLSISGHTDNVGTREKNLDLSQRRADSVRAYLVGKGVPEDRLTTRGAGPDEPREDNKTAAGRQKNRRIEFEIVTGTTTSVIKPDAAPAAPAPAPEAAPAPAAPAAPPAAPQ
jgi:OOP family OmpA-OmpF porin